MRETQLGAPSFVSSSGTALAAPLRLREMEARVPALRIDSAVWAEVSLAFAARENGITVPATDLLVAACRHHEVPLLHHDAHFDLLVT